MAFAMVASVVAVSPMPGQPPSFDTIMECSFTGNDVPLGGELRQIHVFVDDTDTPQTLRSKITDAAIAEALGLGITLAPTQVAIVKEWQKGS